MPTLSPLAPCHNLPARYILTEDPNALLIAAYIKSLADKDARKVETHHL